MPRPELNLIKKECNSTTYSIEQPILDDLKNKLFTGSTSFVDRATLAFFVFDLEPNFGREFANCLQEMADRLKAAFPHADANHLLALLETMIEHMQLFAHNFNSNTWLAYIFNLRQEAKEIMPIEYHDTINTAIDNAAESLRNFMNIYLRNKPASMAPFISTKNNVA